MTRRDALKLSALASAAAITGTLGSPLELRADPLPDDPPKGPFVLPPLPYAYDALEPFIDAETMHLHHDAHHAGYVAKLNETLATPDGTPFKTKNVEWLLANVESLPQSIRTAVRNQGGGHANHSFFWQIMGARRGGDPSGELASAINATFGSLAQFKEKFTAAATGIFGSGWAWLGFDPVSRKLAIETTPNQDSLIMSGRIPVIGLDVWEHAYYLKYQNKRADYVKAWWNVLDWQAVTALHAAMLLGGR